MSIQRPNHKQLATIIKNLGMSMDENEVNFFLENPSFMCINFALSAQTIIFFGGDFL